MFWCKTRETTPTSVYLCECKYWGKPIPQEVIHSFRTVLVDFGAHRGFIISRAGFQTGARDAVRNTNLDLLTFEELQSLFFDRWRVSMENTGHTQIGYFPILITPEECRRSNGTAAQSS